MSTGTSLSIGRVAIVTGGGRDIRRAIGEPPTNAGSSVAVTYFHFGHHAEDALHDFKAVSVGGDAFALQWDMSSDIHAAIHFDNACPECGAPLRNLLHSNRP